jgi:7,8-dihydropterin-6-yl-methyl-4-(beta-D-ribofuranosyl)aminobenzene 5'-phosphate synthase
MPEYEEAHMLARILIDNVTKNEWLAEWGLAVYIEYNRHKILLDTGTTGKFLKNAEAMGIDLKTVDFGVLSHAHYDHANGLGAFFECNARASFYVRNGVRENCYSRHGLFPAYIGVRKGYLKQFKKRMVYVDRDYEIIPGVTLLPHKTPGLSEVGRKAGMYVRQGFRFIPDAFEHEQSLVLDTERGLVIFNSCSHGGADNIINETIKTYPGRKIYALIGGFHLFRSTDEEVRSLITRIRATGIERIYTGHCTGQRAMELLKEGLGEMAQQIYTGLEIVV